MTRENSVAKVRDRIAKPDTHEIDRTLRRLAQAQAALDADEAHWLRIADANGVWPELGYVHALEYLEDVFGYTPRTALERLRVARELGDLPQLEDALRVGELSYSAVRELSRVATPETIDEWLEVAKGLRFRDVERMVSGRKKGDGPDAKPDPALVRHRVVLELDGESLAIWRQMRQVVELELEQSLDDRHLVFAIGERLLGQGDAGIDDDDAESIEPGAAGDGGGIAGVPGDRGAVGDDGADGDGGGDCDAELVGCAVSPSSVEPIALRSRSLLKRLDYMIHIITCRACGGAWQDGGGVRVQVDKSVLERAQCDAIVCDDENGQRARRTIPLAIQRQVLERAQHRCEVPGCRASKHLRIHHIVFWSEGGRHELWNLIVLCDGHHRVLHDGHLTITGRAPDELVFTRNGTRLPHAQKLDAVAPAKETHALRRHAAKTSKSTSALDVEEDNVKLARTALVQAGYTTAITSRAVALARSCVPADASLVDLIKAALRYCQ